MQAEDNNSGIAMLELAAVAAILILLAAFAVPRFASLESETRAASVQALAGGIRSSAALSHALWLANGQPAFVEMQDARIALTYGYPDRATIDDAMSGFSGFSYDENSGVFSSNAAADQCSVSYAEAAGVGAAPVVTVDVTGC